MAKDKKSFILYCDQKEIFDHLSDEQAGKLIKHIFKYVNDEKPEFNDQILKIAFTPIKQSLKRDLNKWSEYIEKQRLNGSKGGRPKKTNNPKKGLGFLDNPTKPKKADSVSVSVSDNTIQSRKLDFKKNTQQYVGKYQNQTVIDFFEYWSEHGDSDKKMRFEKEKSFSVARRLSTWAKNDFNGTEKKSANYIPTTSDQPIKLTSWGKK